MTRSRLFPGSRSLVRDPIFQLQTQHQTYLSPILATRLKLMKVEFQIEGDWVKRPNERFIS